MDEKYLDDGEGNWCMVTKETDKKVIYLVVHHDIGSKRFKVCHMDSGYYQQDLYAAAERMHEWFLTYCKMK